MSAHTKRNTRWSDTLARKLARQQQNETDHANWSSSTGREEITGFGALALIAPELAQTYGGRKLPPVNTLAPSGVQPWCLGWVITTLSPHHLPNSGSHLRDILMLRFGSKRIATRRDELPPRPRLLPWQVEFSDGGAGPGLFNARYLRHG
jgi:hypothetical protein